MTSVIKSLEESRIYVKKDGCLELELAAIFLKNMHIYLNSHLPSFILLL